MNYNACITTDLEKLLVFFSAHCADREMLDELLVVVRNRQKWRLAHGLFQRIRKKSLLVEKDRNEVLLAQRLFEEICAKTIYNLSNEPAPFDSDSPYWVVPNAIALARHLNIAEEAILASITIQ